MSHQPRLSSATPGAALRNVIGARSEPNRFLRGADLADRGSVTSIVIKSGEVRGLVSGSRMESYTVRITTPVTGTPIGAGSPIRWSCTCPDWGDPCKHGVAVMLTVAQQIDDDPDLLADLVGAPTSNTAEVEAIISPPNRPDAPRSAPANATQLRGLPMVAPTWAEGLGETPQPITIQAFFGSTPSGTAAPEHSADPTVGPDRLRQLGPLVVDTYDLAADIIRMYAGLREG